MKPGIKLIFIMSVLLIVSGVLLGCSTSNAAGLQSPSAAASATTPSSIFKISSLAVNPAEVNAGVQILIAAKVTNTGTTDNEYQVNIRIDNTSDSSLPSFLPSIKVKIAAGETQLVSSITTVNNPGMYKVTWDGVSQPLVVNPEENSGLDNPQNLAPVTAPNFSAIDVVTGKKVSLDQYKGSIILLNFVNYGCNPSTNQKVGAQLLAIKQLQSQRNDVVPFSVFCGCCPPEVLRQFAKENNLNWPWILDSDYSIAKKYANYLKMYGYPTLIFVDKDQSITEFTGYTELSSLNEKIDKLEQLQSK
jgi:hypothetical protein